MSFKNLAREYYDGSLNYLSQSFFKCKKKELVKKLKNASSMSDVARLSTSKNYVILPHYIDEEMVFEMLQFDKMFESANRFYVPKKVDTECKCSLEDIHAVLTEDKDAIVECEYQGLSLMLMFSRRISVFATSETFPILCKVFIKDADFIQQMSGLLKKTDINRSTLEYLPWFYTYISEDCSDCLIVIPETNKLSQSLTSWEEVNTSMGVSGGVSANSKAKIMLSLNKKEVSEYVWKTNMAFAGVATYATSVLSYIAYIYNNRGTLSRSNGRARKKYECNSVHKVHTDTQTADKLVPLHLYVKEYEPSVRSSYKGGHHASPIEHDRRAYYRRSRGVGDYELRDGQFINVGKGNGKYSLVTATHVNGVKKSVVYKV